ncbi:beta-lactamase regulating signal transducer with metallopeptidase domain [Algoriphagus sp. 4150]|uniref:M56 family metallopeptidase n=1 Tax=Algoriphagus sp. 4150 TaxID=2817756 RepID=UPI002864C34A|nr:M56 family metallopeptidase [Algoriphagus sp. 4150]MDR7131205.1 beta-lactamase regulating signal transducer with metallopeptidase domain [Algoriphagus sp. 4150]
MNLLNDWISESLLYSMGWTLVHSLWQLVLVGAALWLLLKVFHKSSPRVKYNLALGSLGVSLLCAIATFIYELSSFSPAPLLGRMAFEGLVLNEIQASATLGVEDIIIMLINWIELQLPLLVNFWFVGALLFLFRLFNSLSEIRMLRKSSADPRDFQLEEMLSRLMEKMKVAKKVEIKLTSYGLSPVTFGYLKPIILIPAGLIFQLAPSQLEAIIAHELAHVKRHDYLANLLQSAMEVLFFYHPCYWWMNQTVKELRENAADDIAVKAGISPRELACSLAEVLNFANQNPPELALAAARKRNPTLQRIRRMLGHSAQTYPQNPIISIPMLLTLLLSAGLMATAQQDIPVSIEKTNPISVSVSTTEDLAEEVAIDLTINANVNVCADTVISKSDTVIIKDSNKGSHVYQYNGKTIILEDMPALELPPMPSFPAEAIMPVMDFIMPAMPVMDFEMVPVPGFDMGAMPAMAVEFAGSPDFSFFAQDTAGMTKGEKEKWAKKMEFKANEMAEKAEEWAAKWEENNAGFEEKMQAWQKEFEPKMQEFEKKMAEWQKNHEPRMKEFEAKMKAWQDANEPKMKDYEEKMKAWEKEMQPKMEEYQRKMEIWQKENATKIEEYQKKLEEELKKKDDNE